VFVLSEQMFEVSPNSSHTGAQRSTPLVDCLVDHMLLQTRPCNNQASFRSSTSSMGGIWNIALIIRTVLLLTLLDGLTCGNWTSMWRLHIWRCTVRRKNRCQFLHGTERTCRM